MMTDKASVATWEGVFEASSDEVLTDVGNVTDRLRRGADDLVHGTHDEKEAAVFPVGRGHSRKRIGEIADVVERSVGGRHVHVGGLLGGSRGQSVRSR